MVLGLKMERIWYNNRDWEILNGLAVQVLQIVIRSHRVLSEWSKL